MAASAYMAVFNDTGSAFTLQVDSSNCMLQGGPEGASLAVWEGQTLAPHGRLPSGNPQVIEVNDEGTCEHETSHFTVDIGWNITFTIHEQDGAWEFQTGQPETFRAAVVPPGGQPPEGWPAEWTDRWQIAVHVMSK